ncbi:hypothetical protein JB92DRAFT_3109802 [Gautieria morchelliformis]|nr:hypothetical protein JB92DRAFT_3109802 [Gautieria morchelliformis]
MHSQATSPSKTQELHPDDLKDGFTFPQPWIYIPRVVRTRFWYPGLLAHMPATPKQYEDFMPKPQPLTPQPGQPIHPPPHAATPEYTTASSPADATGQSGPLTDPLPHVPASIQTSHKKAVRAPRGQGKRRPKKENGSGPSPKAMQAAKKMAHCAPCSQQSHTSSASRCPEIKAQYAKKNFQLAVMRHLKPALADPDVFDYNISTAIEARMGQGPKFCRPREMPGRLIEWDRAQPRMAVAANGVAMAALTTKLMEYGHHNEIKYKPDAGSDSRYPLGAFIRRDRQDEISGFKILCSGWHANGHPHEEPEASSRTVLTQHTSCNLLMELSELMSTNNAILGKLDPDAHRMLTELRAAANQIGGSRSTLSVDSSLYPCHALLYNCQTPEYLDEKDHPYMWATLHAFGTFTSGGEVEMPSLGLLIPFCPGDSIFIRGNVLPHKVRRWEGGQRISFTSFAHKSVLDAHSIRDPLFQPPTP